jgi:hypothetical protein
MQSRRRLTLACLTLPVVLGACARDGAAPIRPVPASLVAVAIPAATAAVGTSAGTLTVRVTDDNGVPIGGAVVTFTVSLGGGQVSPAADTTNADGTASTEFTVSPTPGLNEVTAIVTGVAPVKTAVTGLVGSTTTIVIAPRALRFTASQLNATVSAATRDAFANRTTDVITWTARDPSLVSVTLQNAPTHDVATITVLRRPGQTYLVATNGMVSDSIPVSVLDASSTPCTFVATPTTLPAGGTMTFDGQVCIQATDDGAEYAVIGHYNTPVTSVSSRILVTGSGIAAAVPIFPPLLASRNTAIGPETGQLTNRDVAFEHALRERERREIGRRVVPARAWYKATRAAASQAGAANPSFSALPASVREGDRISVNVNANDFCANPDLRSARVVAITDGAIIMADESNPADGFTDAEYRSFGVTMDTLVHPVDTAAFGAPSDIDGNQRVGILFTKAVNELTPQGAGSIVLGFYYVRDLLPKQSPFGDCPGSNVAEMFYILVPDPNGTVNNNVRSKALVQGIVAGTIGHEYQHLINASRRMYINDAPSVDEEVWLNEGLSHIAEELLFYRSSGSSPRVNIAGPQLAPGSPARTSFDAFQRGNFGRYRVYLQSPQTNSPFSRSDQLATRGATWSFLRYLVDQTRTSDGDFWKRLVNSKLTGVPNLEDLVSESGTTTLAALHGWSVSVLMDDIAANVSPPFLQPSWNFYSVFPAVGLGNPYPLAPQILENGQPVTVILPGASSTYLRFAVTRDQEALIQVTGQGGGPLAPGTRLTVARIK